MVLPFHKSTERGLQTIPGISYRSLSNVVNILAPNVSARQVRRRFESLNQTMSAHTVTLTLLSATTGKPISMPMTNVVSYMRELAEQGGFFMKLLSRIAIAQSGSSLELVLYYDEVVPGNVISPDNQRKSYLLYCSFKVFKTWLSCEHAWLPLGIIRSKSLEDVSGGLSAYMCSVIDALRKQLCGDAGLAFRVNGQAFMLHVDKRFLFLQDEAALKSMLGVKGATGVKPCVKCKNILYKRAASLDVDRYFTTICEHQTRRFDLTTDQDVKIIIQHLKEQHAILRPKDFKELQTSSGFNLIWNGVLASEAVGSSVLLANCLFDPMHVYFSNGLVCAEVCLFFKVLERSTSCSWADFEALVATAWKPCSAKTIDNCSQRKRMHLCRSKLITGDHYKGSASDLLTLSPFLLFFLDHVVKPLGVSISKHIESFIALLCAARLVNECKVTSQELNTVELTRCQQRHVDMFCQAYGEKRCRPKHHWQFHFTDQYESHHQILDCFATERKNSEFKYNVAPHCKRLDSFEKSSLSSLLNKQLAKDYEIKNDFEDGLHGSSCSDAHIAAQLGVDDVQVALCLRLGMVVIKAGCFIIFKGSNRGLLVEAVCSTSNRFFLLGPAWDLISEHLNFAYSWWSPRAGSCVLIEAQEAVVA